MEIVIIIFIAKNKRRLIMTDLLIVGAGPAGLTAAIYGRRAGLTVTVFEKSIYGGQLVSSAEIENYPSILNVEGTDLAMNLYTHATSLGAEVLLEEVAHTELEGPVKKVVTPKGEYKGHAIILAGGASRRKLGCKGEDKFSSRGISYCATCDGAFYIGKTVAIVGGGNTALEDALFLSNNCEKVYLIHRRDTFRGEKVLQESVMKRNNIEIIYNTTVAAIEGTQKVESVLLNTPEGEKSFAVDGVFIAVGQVPETAIFGNKLALTAEGYFDIDETCASNIPGVFVAGDIRKKPLRQIVTATSDGAVAAVSAATYCASL